jgi:hypothetical protein
MHDLYAEGGRDVISSHEHSFKLGRCRHSKTQIRSDRNEWIIVAFSRESNLRSRMAHGQTAVLDMRTWLRRSGFNGVEDRKNAPDVPAWSCRENSAGHAHGRTTSLIHSAGHVHGCTTSLVHRATLTGVRHRTTSPMCMARCLRAGRRET